MEEDVDCEGGDDYCRVDDVEGCGEEPERGVLVFEFLRLAFFCFGVGD